MDKDEMLLCQVKAACFYLLRTKHLHLVCKRFFVSTEQIKKECLEEHHLIWVGTLKSQSKFADFCVMYLTHKFIDTFSIEPVLVA